MKIQVTPWHTIAALSLALAQPAVCAQTGPAAVAAVAPEEVTTVQVKGVRDPEIMPYKDAYEFMTKLQASGGGRIETIVLVVSDSTKKPIPGLEVTLQGENTFQKVPVSPGGVVTMPISKEALADKAEFVSNQKKGTISTQLILRPKLPAEQMTYADIMASIEAAQRVRKELIPWYLRIFVPSIRAVAICYPDKSQQVQVSKASQATRPAISEHSDKVGKEQVFCADFEAGDRLIAKDSVISAPAGWRALYL